MGLIYKATCTITSKVYIGQTKHSLQKRRHFHLRATRLGWDNSEFHRAIRAHGEKSIIWEIIEKCSDSMLSERESYWIRQFSTFQPCGYNHTKGGLGSWQRNVSDETRRKIGDKNSGENSAWYGRKHTEDERANLKRQTANWWKTAPAAEVEKRRSHMRSLGLANRGKKASPELRQKLSAAQKALHKIVVISEAQKKRLRELALQRVGQKHPWFGKHHSEETRRILSEKAKNRIMIRDTYGRYV